MRKSRGLAPFLAAGILPAKPTGSVNKQGITTPLSPEDDNGSTVLRKVIGIRGRNVAAAGDVSSSLSPNVGLELRSCGKKVAGNIFRSQGAL